MKWLKRKAEMTANGYWDTISDVMSTLLLILMLVMVLLILYVVRAPEYNNRQSIPESEIIADGVEEQYVEREAGHKVVMPDVPYWLPGSEHEEYGRGELMGDFLYDDGGFEDGEFDGHEGAAVRVIVEDAETHTAIAEAGAVFSLYTPEGRRRTMYTYYPSRTVWLWYETNGAGTFFLPEKLPLASYTLHEITAPTGYALSEDVTFTLEEPHSWKDPYILHVPLTSVRDTISLSAVDRITGAPVPGSVFDIVAAEDIQTMDGTVRYPVGTVADQITIDEEGKGRSIPLYLGNYLIQPSGAPEYYAVGKETCAVTLTEGEDTHEPVEQRMLCDRTQFLLNVVDELYSGTAISGAEFVFENRDAGQKTPMMTDQDGRILLNALDKQTAYRLTQSSAPEGYQLHGKEIAFYVDENGRIAEEAAREETVTNRTLRLAVLVDDALFHNAVSDCRVSLYDDSSRLVSAWSTTELENTVQGMPSGQYRLEISGAGSAVQTVQIEDTAQVQSLRCSVWTMGNKLMVGGSAGGVGTVGAAAGWMLQRRKKRR